MFFDGWFPGRWPRAGPTYSTTPRAHINSPCKRELVPMPSLHMCAPPLRRDVMRRSFPFDGRSAYDNMSRPDFLSKLREVAPDPSSGCSTEAPPDTAGGTRRDTAETSDKVRVASRENRQGVESYHDHHHRHHQHHRRLFSSISCDMQHLWLERCDSERSQQPNNVLDNAAISSQHSCS